MAADAQGDRQILPVASVATMDHPSRPLATATAAKGVALQHALAQSAEKVQREEGVGQIRGRPQIAQYPIFTY
jgi:hypothetical protein